MWDNPRLLNAAANAIFAFTAIVALWEGSRWLARQPFFALRSVRIEGELHEVRGTDVVNALQGRLRGTFFTVDLEAVRAMFETIPWVRRAQVRRLWPDRLEVRLEEQVPLARWGEDGAQLVNAYGEIFAGRSDADLPEFAGPPGSAPLVVSRYAEFRRLLAPLGLEPRQVLLSSRYAWQIVLSNGMRLKLGRDTERDTVSQRLARFAAAYPDTVARLGPNPPAYADLRYPNGFALYLPRILRTTSAHRAST